MISRSGPIQLKGNFMKIERLDHLILTVKNIEKNMQVLLNCFKNGNTISGKYFNHRI